MFSAIRFEHSTHIWVQLSVRAANVLSWFSGTILLTVPCCLAGFQTSQVDPLATGSSLQVTLTLVYNSIGATHNLGRVGWRAVSRTDGWGHAQVNTATWMSNLCTGPAGCLLQLTQIPVGDPVVAADRVRILLPAPHPAARLDFASALLQRDLCNFFEGDEGEPTIGCLQLAITPVQLTVTPTNRFSILIGTAYWTFCPVEPVEAVANRNLVDVFATVLSLHLTPVVIQLTVRPATDLTYFVTFVITMPCGLAVPSVGLDHVLTAS